MSARPLTAARIAGLASAALLLTFDPVAAVAQARADSDETRRESTFAGAPALPVITEPRPLTGTADSPLRVLRQGANSCQRFTFEGLGDRQPIGRLNGPISATFTGSWQSLIDQDAGGTGPFANEPSPSTIAVFTVAGSNTINFSEPVQSVSIHYSAGASSLPLTLQGWSGPNATGNPVGSDSGSVLGDRLGGANCQGDPSGDFCAWGQVAIDAPGNFVRSITFPGALSNGVGFDDLEVCTSSATGECTEDANTLCLNGGRFQVRARWRIRSGGSGQASAVKLTADTGYFWFFDRDNVEAVIKVLDACGINQKFWAFAAGLTDVEVTLTVTDTETGAVRIYENALGTPFAPIQDTAAFETCP